MNDISSFKNWMKHNVQNWFQPGRIPRYSNVMVSPNGKQLQLVMDLFGKGTVKPVIDKRFPLSEAAAAFDFLEQGHATGKVVLYID